MKIEVNSRNYLTLEKGRYSLGGGLTLLVSSPTSRSWVVRFQRNGKRFDYSLGSANHIGITAAKRMAAEVRDAVRNGIDVRPKPTTVDEDKEKPTFEEVAKQAIPHIAEVRVWKNKKHADQWRYTMDAFVYPVIGNIPIDEVAREDILAVLKPIWTEKPETASRVRGRIESIFDFAISRGIVKLNPATWKGGLSSFLPPTGKVATVKHHAAPSLTSLIKCAQRLFISTSPGMGLTILGVLTASRAQEIVGMRWNEIDFGKATWTIPAERMKCGVEHRVPLSRQAIDILNRQKGSDAEFVFPSTVSRGRPMSLETPRKNLKDVTGLPITYHGCRSTFRDWCEENLIHETLAERSLAHINGSKVVRAYQRSDLLEQRREVMQRWADTLLPDV